MNQKIRLGDLLEENNIITQEQLIRALQEQKNTKKRLGSVLVDLEFISEDKLNEFLARQLNIEYRSLTIHDLDLEAVKLIPENIAKRSNVIPISKIGESLYLAMSDPLDRLAIQDVRYMTNLDVKPVLVKESNIKSLIESIYKSGDIKDAANEYLSNLDDLSELDRGSLDINAAPIVKLIKSIFDSATSMNASDIHIEPEEEKMRVRFRIDGVLQEILSTDIRPHNSVVNRIKILSGMNISEKRLPQDGRILHDSGGLPIDMRVSSMPTNHGEKIVIRLLNRASFMVNKKSLGFSKDDEVIFEKFIKKPYGIIIVTGPTGSGKTTTLYSMLNELNDSKKNIITLEDPIEFDIKGISQTQVNIDAGLFFTNGLRSILRQDPDVVMVGEIRDSETAEIGIRAALTGHLVLTTLHTNNAVGSIPRLVDMGIEPFLLSSSLIGVISQRLVRLICPVCKIEYNASEEEKKILGFTEERELKLYKGQGCKNCMNSGFRGRTGVFEVLEISREIRKLIDDGASGDEIGDMAISQGFKELIEDGKKKVFAGITTVGELIRAAYING